MGVILVVIVLLIVLATAYMIWRASWLPPL
jgi:hypothetical protein